MRDAAEHRTAGRFADALLLLLKAVRLNRHGVQARIDLAGIWEELARWPEALAAWQETLRWHQLPQAQLGLARVALRSGDLVLAAKHGEATLQQLPDDAEAVLLQAEVCVARGNASKARDHLLHAAALAQLPASVWPRLDRALRAIGESGPADRLYQRYAHELPRSAPGLIAALSTASNDAAARESALAEAAAWQQWTEAELIEVLSLAGRFGLGGTDGALGLARSCRALVDQRLACSGGLGWPRRTAGTALRVGILFEAWTPSAPELIDDLRTATAGLETSLRVYLIDESGDAQKAEWRELPVATLGRFPLAQAVRFIAEDDCDVLVVGGDPPGPPLLEVLAHRPAPWLVGWRLDQARSSPLLIDALVQPRGDTAETLKTSVFSHESWRDAAIANRDERTRRGQGNLAAESLRAYRQSALQLHRDGRAEDADRQYSALLADQPDAAAVLYMRACLRRDVGALRAAAVDLAAALAAQPEYLDARYALAQIQFDLGAFAEAAETCNGFGGPSIAEPRLLRILAQAQRKLDLPEEAKATLVRAAALTPGEAGTWLQLGLAANALGHEDEAQAAWQKAAVLDPQAPESFFNLGALHQQRQENEQAAACYEQVIRLRPREAQAYKYQGEVLFASGNYAAWLANFERFERACPGALSLAIYALEACQFAGNWARLEYYLNGLEQQRFQPANPTDLVDGLEELLYLLLFFDLDVAQLGRFYRTYSEAASKVYGSARPRPELRRPGRLRIGYLSGDVRDHVMGKMIYQWLDRHDRQRFEVYLYATRLGEDAWAKRMTDASDHFASLVSLSDEAAIARIEADDIDLLIDCSTHTRGARQAILAAKPARVQITSVGSAGCLGMSSIDFKLTDRIADLPEMQEHQVEPLLAMAACVYPHRAIAMPQAPVFRRDQLGIGAQAVVIGAFVNLLKLTRRCLKLWREILDRLPEAVVALSPTHPGQREAYVRVFRAGGIDAERLVFVPQGRDESENQARYALVDFVLDPMPFGGANGTIEALAMGVPVVTLCGRRHGERVGTSILSHLGATLGVAQSGPEYIELAVRLAHDSGFRAEVLQQIQDGMRRSTFVDGEAHIRNLEAAYLAALRSARPEIYGELGDRA